jgi:antitoxin component YwqK of YwqJK toxin-antitoxin module
MSLLNPKGEIQNVIISNTMKKLFYFILFFSQVVLSQEVLKNSFDGIYQSDGLIYRKASNELFTETIEFYKNEEVLNRKLVYNEGYLESDTFFHNNSNELKTYFEFIYHKEKTNSDTKEFTVASRKHFDKNGVLRHHIQYSKNGKLEKREYFTKNGKIRSLTEYKDGVKHGKDIFYRKDKECCTVYENGKKVK